MNTRLTAGGISQQFTSVGSSGTDAGKTRRRTETKGRGECNNNLTIGIRLLVNSTESAE